MNDLVIGIAHEVNTPLGCTITASSHLLYVIEEIENAKDTATLLQRNLDNTAYLISQFKRLSTLDIEPIPEEEINLKQ